MLSAVIRSPGQREPPVFQGPQSRRSLLVRGSEYRTLAEVQEPFAEAHSSRV